MENTDIGIDTENIGCLNGDFMALINRHARVDTSLVKTFSLPSSNASHHCQQLESSGTKGDEGINVEHIMLLSSIIYIITVRIMLFCMFYKLKLCKILSNYRFIVFKCLDLAFHNDKQPEIDT